MKTFVCLFLLACLANNAVYAHRGLQAVVVAKSSASSTGGTAKASSSAEGSGDTVTVAESVANATGCANAETDTTAKDGASVKASTEAGSDGCVPVSAKTTAEGEGEDTNLNVQTKAITNKPINVTVTVKKYENVTNVTAIATEIVDDIEKFKSERLPEELLKFPEEDKWLAVVASSIDLFFARKKCDGFKTFVKGFETRVIGFKISTAVANCLYEPCSNIESAKGCCGAAQLKDSQCGCKDGVCKLKKDKYIQNTLYWICDDCVSLLCTC